MADMSRRIVKETQKIVQDAPPGISAHPSEDNMRHFDVIMAGPVGSPYEGAPPCCSAAQSFLTATSCPCHWPSTPLPLSRAFLLLNYKNYRWRI